MNSEQNRVRCCWLDWFVWLDWFDNRTHSILDVGFCSITEPNRTVDDRLSSIEFRFDFV